MRKRKRRKKKEKERAMLQIPKFLHIKGDFWLQDQGEKLKEEDPGVTEHLQDQGLGQEIDLDAVKLHHTGDMRCNELRE